MILLGSTSTSHGSAVFFCTLPWLYIALLDSLHSTMTQLDTISLHWTLLYTIPQVYLDLLDSTTLYHRSTWLYFTLLHSHHGFTWFYLALPDPTYTLPWLYLTLLHNTTLYHGSTRLYSTLYHGSTWLYLTLLLP